MFAHFEGLARSIALQLWDDWRLRISSRMDLEDLVQSSLVYLLELVGQLDVERSLGQQTAFVMSVVRRGLMNDIRRITNDRVICMDPLPTRASQACTLSPEARGALDTLSVMEGFVCRMLVGGWQISEIAKIVGCPVPVIRHWRRSIRNKLKELQDE